MAHTPPASKGPHSRLVRLAQEPDRATPSRIWASLPDGERSDTIALAVQDPEFIHRDHLLQLIADNVNFRKQTVAGLTPAKIGEYGARTRTLPQHIAGDLLVYFHLGFRAELLGDFLDLLGLQHECGVIKEDLESLKVDSVLLLFAADALLTKHDPSQVTTYFLVLYTQSAKTWTSLGPWLQQRAGEWLGLDALAAKDDGNGDDLTGAEEPESSVQDDLDEFTTLDRRLVRVIVDVAQGIDGTPTEDELDDLIDEVVHLNGARHRSQFHVGLRDALVKRVEACVPGATNEIQRRWYFAGFTQGLARLGHNDAIVKVFDAHPTIRDLGDTGLGPSMAASRLVFIALVDADRAGEAYSFLSVQCVARNPVHLPRTLLRAGSRLLREQRAHDAKPIFSLAVEAMERAETEGVEFPRDFVNVLRRRLANACRELGETASAKSMLYELLDAPDLTDRHRSMALVDLGLVICRFRRLADLRLPADENEQQDLASQLAPGEQYFSEASGLPTSELTHASYALGMLAFYRGEWARAVHYLDDAVSGFDKRPLVYGPGRLTATGRAALALSLCHEFEVEQMERAARLMELSCADGMKPPLFLVEWALVALAERGTDLAQKVAEMLVTGCDPEMLDLLVERRTVAERSRAIVDALLTRSQDEARRTEERLADSRSIMRLLLSQGRIEEAEGVLDFLQNRAMNGEGREQFLHVLVNSDNYDPAWCRDDALWAQTVCLESMGRYEEAAILLEQESHRIISSQEHGWIQEVENLISRIKSYGECKVFCDNLERRLRAVQDSGAFAVEMTPQMSRVPVRVLVVGGNEVQARYDDAIKKDLLGSDSEITVSFNHTGWKGNWNEQLAEVKRALPAVDGVVMMRYMRTMLGRRIRKELKVPWRGCGGSGRRAITDSIRLAAADARGAMDRRLRESGEVSVEGS